MEEKTTSSAAGKEPNSRAAFLREETKSFWLEYGLENFLPLSSTQSRQSFSNSTSVIPVSELDLSSLNVQAQNCDRCGLCEHRSQVVFGSGNSIAPLVFVGEAPGEEEEQTGLPFAGKVGGLLTKIIEAMGYPSANIYFTNLLKCRPPSGRDPLPEEIEKCVPILKRQLELIQPQVIVALGLHSARALTGQQSSMANIRGRFAPLAWAPHIWVMPTYHPAYLLRSPAAKRLVWEDIKKVKSKLEESRA